jgi:SAM-dependent methyltransferase
VFSEVARVLKPDGGLYIADFGHLKSEASIDYFANQYADRQPEIFTRDYLNSLRAAFTFRDIKSAAVDALGNRARVYSTFLVPYMVAVKSTSKCSQYAATNKALRALLSGLPHHHQVDFYDLCTFFRLGGLKSGVSR